MLLPENKPSNFDKTPTKFFVWGARGQEDLFCKTIS